MLVGTNKHHPVSSLPRRGVLHARTRTHWVTIARKRVEEYYTSASARASETNALVGPDTHRCGIAGKPNHDTVPPAHALVYQLVLSCGIVIVYARCVRHSPYPVILCHNVVCRCITAAGLICRFCSLV